MKSYLQNNRNNFTVFTLNVQSLNSKFSEIQSLISDLSKDNLLFDAICFQETWLHTNDDVGIFHLPAYNIIHKGKICCGHGGLVIYLNNRYTHTFVGVCTRYERGVPALPTTVPPILASCTHTGSPADNVLNGCARWYRS